MKFYKVIWLAIFIVAINFGINGQVTIKGNAPTYAGSEIIFKILSDPITLAESEIAKCKVQKNGDFSMVFKTNEITCVFSYLGVYKGFLFVEPGKTYEISLPEKVDKTEGDKLNPFFEETEFQFSVKKVSEADLNFLILTFDDAYLPYLSMFAKNTHLKNTKALVDSAIVSLKKINLNSNNQFFKNYVNYKIGNLNYLALQQKSKSISNDYFQKKPVLLNNPAYVELFGQLYGKYLFFFGRTTNGKRVYDDVNKDKSYSKLCQTLKSDSVLQNDTLRELVILKNIHEEFYAANFSRSGLLQILDSLSCTTKIENHKRFALNIRNKITKLMPGFEPPPFELLDKDSNLVKLVDLKGKYVYLNFCACASYSCIKEFDALKRINEKYKDKLTIITIATDESRTLMVDFLKQADYAWPFLHYGNQPEIMENYDIRAYPTYFLIGPDGKLIFSPAVSPGENFEQYLFQAMRARKDI